MNAVSTRRWITTGAIAFLAPLIAATSLQAQSPTPEGTVITNTATATWTDANGNTYTPVTASASMTVGFLAGPDATSPTTVTPASPSTGNSLPFTINNTGNGTDQFSVTTTAGAGVSITGYTFGGNSYSTLALLNAALATANVTAGSSEIVNVIYTVAPGRGGLTSVVSLTATSLRTPSASDPSSTNVTPPVAAGVSVTPDGALMDRLPSNGVQYSQTFVVTNNGNANDTYTLLASATGSAVSVVSVNGAAGTGGSIVVASGGTQNVTVVYTVGNVAAGSTDVLKLTATSTNDATTKDDGTLSVRVIRAALSMTKQAFRDDQSTPITGSDRVLPGEYVQYKISVSNTGGADAGTVAVTDPLPSALTYVSATPDAAGWTISQASGTVTATLTGTLAPAASRYVWVRVRVK